MVTTAAVDREVDRGDDRVGPPTEPPAHAEFAKRRAMRLDRHSEVGKRARRAVHEHCVGRIDHELVEHARLVASELVTNAFEHCTVGVVTLDVSLAGGGVVLTVTSPGPNHSRGIPPVNAWRVPPPSYPSGRGLGMIRLIADEVVIDSGSSPDGSQHWQAVTVWLSAPDAG